jgi:hypothetical protein
VGSVTVESASGQEVATSAVRARCISVAEVMLEPPTAEQDVA